MTDSGIFSGGELQYDLPPEKIALFPSRPRDACRLMAVNLNTFEIQHKIFNQISDFFDEGDVIAVNDSRVINARIKGEKETGGKVEFLLIEKTTEGWKSFGKPAARLREGMKIKIKSEGKTDFIVIKKKFPEGEFIIEAPEDILSYGEVPLPPYIASKRAVVQNDEKDYQTIFAQKGNSVAAPTSVLHFTDKLTEKIREKGVRFAGVTLNIGPGTFKPATSAPDSERYEVSSDSANLLNGAKRICICGTTVMRVLETVSDGKKISPSRGRTDLFIYPGYKFKTKGAFLTNFHLPGTSLLLMVAAFIEQYYPGYRFLSYGDAMLLTS